MATRQSTSKRRSPVRTIKSRRASGHAPDGTLRFAHPFFDSTPPETRAAGPHGQRLLDHIKGRLEQVPKTRGDGTFTLADVIGQAGSDAIERAGSLAFHAVGDSGRKADSPQGDVAAAMAKDFDTNHPERCPAFFLHLGDVIYGANKVQKYRPEFYEPYVHYPGKIIAVPGNHDGETFPRTDTKTLEAFLANFCAPRATVPPIAGTIFRQTMTQPGAYWFLDAPLLQIVGLYSNAAENPGFISGGAAGTVQRDWLLSTLKRVRAARDKGSRKALVFAAHHPPFTAGGHSPSQQMLAEIDAICQKARVMPDLFLSGHAHSYQRYTRFVTFEGKALEIPYVVAGTGGINDQAVPAATGARTGDHAFIASHKGYGYLRLTCAPGRVGAAFVSVDGPQTKTIDQASVDLASGKVG